MTSAFERFWSLGFRRLTPIIPPDAEISPRSILSKRVGTHQDGRGKTPGVRTLEGWVSFDWTNHEADERDLTRWAEMGAGVGIKTGQQPDGTWLVPIDADTLDQQHAITIRDIIDQRLGRLSIRVGQPPKALYLVRASAPFNYTRFLFGPADDTGNRERVEILSEGKQFVASGPHPKTGKPYAWPRDTPAYPDIPVVTPEELSATVEAIRAALPEPSKATTEGASTNISQAALRGDPDKVREAVDALPNTSNHFPAREDYLQVGYAIKAAIPDEDDALELFKSWCDRWTDGDNATDIVEADWARMKPPYRRGASWLYEMAAEHGGFDPARVWFDTVDPDALPAPNPFSQIVEQPDQPPLRAGRLSLDDLDDLPPRQWLYGFKILRKYVTFIASPGGVGKTAATIAMALSCAANKPLLHDVPRSPRPLRVWLFNLEDDIIEIRRRVAAAVRHYGLDQSVLDNVYINSGRDRGVRIVKVGQNGFVVQPDFEALCGEIEREQIDIAVFDPFLRTHGVSENENEAQDEVMRLFAQIAERTNCGIVLVHHTKKGAVAGDMDSLRGGSTQGGGARAAFTLSAMSAEDAGKLGVPEVERRLYVRVDDAKNNMAPPAAKAEWLKLASYNLGNSTEDYPRGDEVQVATPWTPPNAWDGISTVEADILRAIDAGLDDGERYSARAQDKERWVGTLLVEEFDRTPQQAKEIVDGWLRAKLIEVRDYKSGTQRKTRKGLFVVNAPAPDVEVSGASASVFD